MKYTIEEYMSGYLSNLKAIQMWLHAAHHVTKGKGFLSDHNDLYGMMYNQVSDHFDILVEKSIGLSGREEIACPLTISRRASSILNRYYETPANASSEEIVKGAIVGISNLINSLTSLYENFKESGYLTLGLEDALTSMANEYEKYLYFLGQRYKN